MSSFGHFGCFFETARTAWLDVLRRFCHLAGFNPAVFDTAHGVLTPYIRPAMPGLHNACVVQCIGSIPHDELQVLFILY
jgi:hypothetical protein